MAPETTSTDSVFSLLNSGANCYLSFRWLYTFAFVWKPKEYWFKLLERNGFKDLTMTMNSSGSLINLEVFKEEKPIANSEACRAADYEEH